MMNFFTRVALVCLLACVAVLFTGCEAVSFFTQAFSDDTPAIYKLQDRPTVVLVDDPTGQLGDPSLEGAIATQVGFVLHENETVKVIIPQSKVAVLAGKLGPEFIKTPLDRIGREVGAEQIISIYVESAEPNVDEEAYRPRLSLRVKVIEAADGKRLFPSTNPNGAGDELTATRGYQVAVQLFYRTTIKGGKGDLPVVLQKLVEKAGRDVARLFFKHRLHEPGEKFED